VIRDRFKLRGRPGDLCSLLAIGGPALGVTTDGLRYPLHGEELLPGSTRGISNVFAEAVATVALEQGSLLTIQPDNGEQ
jgi:thiamine pyrophosphokinase